ncbi:hypothetical protein [Muribaculum intestinale]|uniref:hypothetical protein n=1 Tax=Muribaculum intestinale TaxID=1796646 RepID=UPI003F663D75
MAASVFIFLHIFYLAGSSSSTLSTGVCCKSLSGAFVAFYSYEIHGVDFQGLTYAVGASEYDLYAASGASLRI